MEYKERAKFTEALKVLEGAGGNEKVDLYFARHHGIFRAEFVQALQQENKKIAEDISLIQCAIATKTEQIKNYTWVESLLNTLTDANEVNELIANAPTTSIFCQNRNAADNLKRRLEFWLTDAEIISERDNLLKVIDALSKKIKENKCILVHHGCL